MKIAIRIAAGVAVLLLLVAGAGVWIAQSDWLRDRVRTIIVEQTEKATGGKVELGSFQFDWRTLDARLNHFVIHGTEPSGAAPLLAVDRATVRLTILSLVRRSFHIDHIEVEHPQAHVIFYPGGRTNLPQPRSVSRGNGLQTILDLKIGRFDLAGGTFLVESPGEAPRISPWSAQGRELKAVIGYDPGRTRYAGEVSVSPLHLLDTDFDISADAAVERNRVVVSRATIRSAPGHRLDVTITGGQVSDFTHPVYTAHYDATVGLPEAVALLKVKEKVAGDVRASGDARFASPADYLVTGTAQGQGLAWNRFRNAAVKASYEATPGGVQVRDARIDALGGRVVGNAESRDYKTISARGRIEHFDLREAAKLETERPLPYDGLVSGTFELSGRVERFRPSVKAVLDIAPAGNGPAARGQVAVRYDTAKPTIELGQSWIQLPNTRVDVSGTLGLRLAVRAQSRDVNDILPALDLITGGKTPALSYGSATFEGAVTGALDQPVITGHAAAQNFKYENEQIEAASGDVTVSSESASAANASVTYSGISGQGRGSVQLQDWRIVPASAVNADVEVKSAGIPKLLALAGHKEVEMTGTLGANAHIAGTFGNPAGSADVTLSKGAIYSQPFDSITGRVQAPDKNTQEMTGLFVSGPKRVNISGRFVHAGTTFSEGTLDFNLTSNTMPLKEIALVRARQPDILGFGKFHADGALRIGYDGKHEIQFDLLSLNADASANSLELGGRNLGDARLTAQTQNGVVQGHFESNAAQAAIRGDGTVRLEGDYPLSAKVTFTKAGLNALAASALRADQASSLNFDGELEGEVNVSGALRKLDQIAASVDVSRLEVHALKGSDLAKTLPTYSMTNAGPIRVAVNKSEMKIESARFQGPETDLNVTGSIAFAKEIALNLGVRGAVNLAIARSLSPDLTASGAIDINATVRGDANSPDFSGRANIRNGEFHYADFSNGLTNANGEIAFSGTRATLQSFHGESGGGKVDASGFAAYSAGTVNFRIEARTQQVRIRYPEGVSSISDASLTLAGTSDRSQVSGQVAIHRVSINPKADASSILAATAEPLKTPAVRTGIFSNMNLDVRIQTAPDVALQTSVAQSIEADANLTLRGTVTNPALLGRINITQGELNFFGNKYTISQGTISFFNASRIEPILNVDFQTKARGVDVTITVSGPINKPNVTYRSDPPLQFSEVVALLATGRTPSDPTLAVRDTAGQSQSFQQLGASTLLGQAIANPVAGRLQRFFGVSRLKIDPQLTGVTGSPEARLTLEQQVTPDLLFTYITDVSSTSTQLIRVEWAFNRHWSAILTREENGYVGLDFAYKKRFK